MSIISLETHPLRPLSCGAKEGDTLTDQGGHPLFDVSERGPRGESRSIQLCSFHRYKNHFFKGLKT